MNGLSQGETNPLAVAVFFIETTELVFYLKLGQAWKFRNEKTACQSISPIVGFTQEAALQSTRRVVWDDDSSSSESSAPDDASV